MVFFLFEFGLGMVDKIHVACCMVHVFIRSFEVARCSDGDVMEQRYKIDVRQRPCNLERIADLRDNFAR